MLPLLLALAISAPRPPEPALDARLVGCFVNEKIIGQPRTGYSAYTTLCLFPDGSARQELIMMFLVYYGGGGAIDKEIQLGTWTYRRGTLVFDGEERLTWRAEVLEDGLRLDGRWYERKPLPEPDAGEPVAGEGESDGDEAAAEEEEEGDPELERLGGALRELLEAYVREHAPAE